jgi:hypothetical protein
MIQKMLDHHLQFWQNKLVRLTITKNLISDQSLLNISACLLWFLHSGKVQSYSGLGVNFFYRQTR